MSETPAEPRRHGHEMAGPPCARCGQEECATVHMTNDTHGGHDYEETP